MRRAVVWLFYALVITVPFAFTAINEELFEFNKMMLVYAFTVLIAGVWTARMIREKRFIFSRTALFWPILIFLASQVLSTVTSIHIPTSVFGYYSRFHGGLLSTVSYIVLYFAAVSNLDKRNLLPFVRSTVYAGMGAALYALPEHFGVSPSCVLITGEFSVSCWVQDVQTRVFGTFGQPNWLAAYLIVLLPLTLWLWTKSKPGLHRWLSAAAWPLFLAVLLFTGSRSGFLGLGIGLAALLAVWFAPLFLTTIRKQKLAALSLSRQALSLAGGSISVLLLLCLVFGTPFTPSLGKMLSQPSAPTQTETPSANETSEAPPSSGTVLENGGTDSGSIRRIVWTGALDVWRRYPILGSGVETFAYSYYQDRPLEHNLVSEWDFLYNKAHNEFLNTLATTGIVGLGALLLLMGAFVLLLLRQRSPLALALLAGYTGLAVSNALGFSTVMVGVLFFFMMAWFFIDQNEPPAETKQSASSVTVKKHRPSRSGDEFEVELDTNTLVLGGVALLTGFALLSVMRTWDNDRLLALAKRQVAFRQPTAAYELFQRLTSRAPNEAVYWDEQATFLANLAAAAASTDATLSGEIANQAAAASDRAVTLNPVHLSLWKSRAKAFLYLATVNPQYTEFALQSLDQAAQLAPTDPKIQFNRGLVLDQLGRPEEARAAFSLAIQMRPNYEQARNEFGKFLESIGDLEAAAQQYRYVSTQLKPGEEFSTGRLREIEAILSAKKV